VAGEPSWPSSGFTGQASSGRNGLRARGDVFLILLADRAPEKENQTMFNSWKRLRIGLTTLVGRMAIS